VGERVWMNRRNVPVPEHQRVLPNILSGVSALGGAIVVWGTATLRLWPTLLGVALVYLGKIWFIDRMVWPYEEMKDAPSEDRKWLY
jgi:hypothetical protein